MPVGWNWWSLPGSGLYEYGRLGDRAELAGFFVVNGRNVRSISPDEAFQLAARLRPTSA